MLGAALREARLSAGMTQERLAAKAKLTREYVSQLERGLSSPTVDMFVRLCHAMGVSAGGLLASIEKPQSDLTRKR